MVFIVQANVVCKEVKWPIVRVRFRNRDLICRVKRSLLWLFENVVLRNEMPRTWVQAPRQERAQDEICHCLSADELNKCVVESELDDNVEEVDHGHRELVHEHRTQSIEEDLEGSEEGFPGYGVEEEGFEGGGEVGVESLHAEGFVVRKMIGLFI